MRVGLRGIAVALLALAGCSQPPVTTVTGVVAVDGKPLKTGFITLEPAQGATASASAVIADGRFSIGEGRGIPPGDYIVRLDAPDLDRCDPAGPPNAARPIVPLLSAPWNKASTLGFTVQPGTNRLDIAGRREGPPTRQP